MRPTEERLQAALQFMHAAERSHRLTPAAAATLLGRLTWVMSRAYGSSGRAATLPLGRRHRAGSGRRASPDVCTSASLETRMAGTERPDYLAPPSASFGTRREVLQRTCDALRAAASSWLSKDEQIPIWGGWDRLPALQQAGADSDAIRHEAEGVRHEDPAPPILPSEARTVGTAGETTHLGR